LRAHGKIDAALLAMVTDEKCHGHAIASFDLKALGLEPGIVSLGNTGKCQE
jgi:hypothetical protein